MVEELTRESKIGAHVAWSTLDGKTHYGTLKEWDSNVAIVVDETGKENAVEC